MRRSRYQPACLVLCCLLMQATAGQVRAAPAKAAKPPAVKPVAAPSPTAQSDAIAEEAKRRYRQGEYGIAAELFARANGLDPRPDRVYNMARCQEKLGNMAEAIRLLGEYADSTTDVAGREEARIRSRELERQFAVAQENAAAKSAADKAAADAKAAAQAQAAAEAKAAEQHKAEPEPVVAALPAPVTAATLARVEPNSPTPGWMTLGAGAALGATGLGLFLAGMVADGSLQGRVDETNSQGHVTGSSEVDADRDARANGQMRSAGAAIGLTGLAVVGVGAWLWWRGSRVEVALAPQGIALTGGF